MILRIYIVLLSLFALGGIGFYFINRKKDFYNARNNWIKYISYFFIIHALFVSIIFFPAVFRWLVILIILVGLFEMTRLFYLSGFSRRWFFSISLLIYAVLSVGFYLFSGMDNKMILFVFLILSIFDAFSQVTGQLAGRTKIFPHISPSKTLEGFIGGAFLAISSSLIFKNLIDRSVEGVMILSSIVVLAAFIGDMASSIYKRQSNVKDFSSLIPGHGGFLDRFDSFIAAGAFLAMLKFFIK